ncbi:hypothetical protein CR513_13194, partial [Mucuna pruriens]
MYLNSYHIPECRQIMTTMEQKSTDHHGMMNRKQGKNYDNYDHITKVHEIKLSKDEGQRKGKSITLKSQKT